MWTKSKYIAVGIIIGLGLAATFSLLKDGGSVASAFLKAAPFVLLTAMLILVLYWRNKHDRENKG